MRSVVLTLCVAAVAVAVTAGPALGDEDPGAILGDRPGRTPRTVRVTPSTVAPGGEVEVRVFGCPGKAATATSPAFVTAADLAPAADGGLYSEASVRSTATPGPHTVTVNCGATDASDVDAADASDATPEAEITVVVDGPASPTAPVQAGGGGTARGDAKAKERDDFGAVEAYGLVLAGGTALVVGGLAVQRRRRRSSRTTSSG